VIPTLPVVFVVVLAVVPSVVEFELPVAPAVRIAVVPLVLAAESLELPDPLSELEQASPVKVKPTISPRGRRVRRREETREVIMVQSSPMQSRLLVAKSG